MADIRYTYHTKDKNTMQIQHIDSPGTSVRVSRTNALLLRVFLCVCVPSIYTLQFLFFLWWHRLWYMYRYFFFFFFFLVRSIEHIEFHTFRMCDDDNDNDGNIMSHNSNAYASNFQVMLKTFRLCWYTDAMRTVSSSSTWNYYFISALLSTLIHAAFATRVKKWRLQHS